MTTDSQLCVRTLRLKFDFDSLGRKGIGQVVTLKFPAEKLRDINVLIERAAWGAYRTEFYPTYDYRGLYKQEQSKNP